ncbi:MAG TPA: ABC transporter permease [Acidobacteriaceae bacterium]|nr:ABC transporter permease [Terriglobia bacterium]HVC91399.1 ABC transporter permease [Acidobacteriaceae bacterium]
MNPVETHSHSFARTLASAKQTMVLSEILSLAFDSFRNNKVRFALTALGMVMGSASVILVATIGLTGRQYAINLIQGIGANMIVADCQCGGMNPDFLTNDDLTAVDEQVPGIIWSSPMLEMQVPISFGDGKVKDILVLGVSPQYKKVRNLMVLSGRFFDEEDTVSHAKVAVVTVPFAESLFGNADRAINQTFTIRGIPFTIIGVFKERVNTWGMSEISKQTILIPYPVGRYFTGTDAVKQLFFSVKNFSDTPRTRDEIAKVIQSRHRPGSVYDVVEYTALVDTAAHIADIMTLVLLLVSAVTLAVSGVGIMNIMLATVRSRIREIGIRKAVGATYREVQLQFLAEAILISLSGGIVGTLLGLALPLSVRFFLPAYTIPISPWSVVISLGTAMMVGVLFGTLPATRAAQMDPVESLKYE